MFSSFQRGTPAGRRYVVRTLAFMTGYVAVLLFAKSGAWDDVDGTAAGWGLAAAVSAPILGQIWTTLAFMRDSDEFVRALIAKQFILAAGLSMAVATFWGFGETFAAAPHVEGWFIYPLFWACFALVTPFARTSR